MIAETDPKRRRSWIAALTLAAALLAATAPAPALAAVPGDYDLTFSSDGRQTVQMRGFADGMALAPGGKTVLAGTVTVESLGNREVIAVVRLLPDGSLDPTFSSDGKMVVDAVAMGDSTVGTRAYDVAVQPDGKVVLVGQTGPGGSNSDLAFARVKADGTLDPSFAGNGILAFDLGGSELGLAVALQPDGKIVATGDTLRQFTENMVVRLNQNGLPDNSFGNGGIVYENHNPGDHDSVQGTDIVVQPDGKIVVVGLASTANDGLSGDFSIVRLLPGGAQDPSFSGDGATSVGFGGEDDYALAVGLQSDGSIVVAGETAASGSGDGTPGDAAVTRLTPQGNLDTSFGILPGASYIGYAGIDHAQALAIDPKDNILLGISSGTRAIATRLFPSGSPDYGYGAGGKLLQFGNPGTTFAHPVGIAVGAERKTVVGLRASGGFSVARLLGGESQRCQHFPATIAGTNGAETVNGTTGDDTITGLGGADTVAGLAGFDLLCGGSGGDDILGANGDDDLYGEAGSDTLDGGRGFDRCYGGRETDTAIRCEQTVGIP